MTCPSCSQPVPEGARFCPNCGATLPVVSERADEPGPAPGFEAAPPPPPPTPPPPAPPPADRDAEPEPMPRTVTGEPSPGAGFLRAILLGALVFVVVLLLSAVVSFALFFTSDADALDVTKLSGVIFYSFHHVGMHVEFPTFDPSAAPGADMGAFPVGPVDLSFTLSLALLLGTLLALVLLYRAGRRAAEEGGGGTGTRILQGAAVALPYAALSGLLSYLVRFELELGPELAPFLGSADLVEVRAPLLASLLWPLGLAAVAGAFGGYAAARRDLATPTPGRVGAMVSGGWRMLLAALVGGFIGLLVLGALNPDLTASYFEAVGSGRSGLALLLATIAAVPNLALWGLTLGMGGSIVAGDFLGLNARHFASLLEFPSDLTSLAGGGALLGGEGLAEVPTAVAPIEYFAFVPLLLIALIVGGRLAAGRARVATAGQGAIVGAGSGVVFAVAFLAALVLAGITQSASFTVGGVGEPQLLRFGPGLPLGGLLALAWGVVAGAIGGATGTFAAVPSALERRPAPPPPPPLSEREEESTRELPPETVPAAPPPTSSPSGGGTGFEGLASERAALQGRPEPESEPEPELESPPEAAIQPPPPPASGPSDAAGETPTPGEPPAFEFTSPRDQWAPPEPSAQPEAETGWRAPEPEPAEPPAGEEPGESAAPVYPPQEPAPERPRPEEPPPWSDPAAFEPRPWSEEVVEEERPVTEPWVGPEAGEEDEDDEDEEEGGPKPFARPSYAAGGGAGGGVPIALLSLKRTQAP